MRLDQKKDYDNAIAEWQYQQAADEKAAREHGSVPFYSDWLIRPKNASLWLALRGARTMFNGDPIYDQMIESSEKVLEKKKNEWLKKNPKGSSWFDL